MNFIIHFDATTEELEKALPFTKGKWKPYNAPYISMKGVNKIEIGSLGKFEYPQPSIAVGVGPKNCSMAKLADAPSRLVGADKEIDQV